MAMILDRKMIFLKAFIAEICYLLSICVKYAIILYILKKKLNSVEFKWGI